MKTYFLKEEITELEKDFETLGNKLELLSCFASPGKLYNKYKAEEFYEIKRNYEKIRKEINNRYTMIREIDLNKNKNSFVNSFGEATNRYITNTTYEKQQKRLSKEIMNFIR